MTQKPCPNWVNWAIGRIDADYTRSADTHLIPVPLPALPHIAIYLKDESSHPTGSLKHRLARSLFLYALCNGWIAQGMTIVEASSGSTAVSEAYFARMLGLPFIAVVPRSTAPEKSPPSRRWAGNATRSTARARFTARPRVWPRSWAAITWISSPMPNAPPIGAATTISPTAFSARWRVNPIRSRHGS
jgi:hypothetical protein